VSSKKKGKREYLNNIQTRDLTNQLNDYFEATVEIRRIKVGRIQTIESLINEEALLLAKYLRGENDTWVPRVPSFPFPTVLECQVDR